MWHDFNFNNLDFLILAKPIWKRHIFLVAKISVIIFVYLHTCNKIVKNTSKIPSKTFLLNRGNVLKTIGSCGLEKNFKCFVRGLLLQWIMSLRSKALALVEVLLRVPPLFVVDEFLKISLGLPMSTDDIAALSNTTIIDNTDSEAIYYDANFYNAFVVSLCIFLTCCLGKSVILLWPCATSVPGYLAFRFVSQETAFRNCLARSVYWMSQCRYRLNYYSHSCNVCTHYLLTITKKWIPILPTYLTPL